MHRMSLERRIQCGQQGRVSDINTAETFILEAADEPFKNCFKGRPAFYEYVLKELGLEKDLEDIWVSEDDIKEQKKRYGRFTYCEACRKLIENDQNGWEIKASVIEAFADIYRDIEHRQQNKETGARTASPYVRAENAGYSGTELCFFLVGNISMKEYFQVLSFVTQNEADARIPDVLPPCEDRTIIELLDQTEVRSGAFLERVRVLLIEPFARIHNALYGEQH